MLGIQVLFAYILPTEFYGCTNGGLGVINWCLLYLTIKILCVCVCVCVCVCLCRYEIFVDKWHLDVD